EPDGPLAGEGLGELEHDGAGGLDEVDEAVLDVLGEVDLGAHLAVVRGPRLPGGGVLQAEADAVIAPARVVGAGRVEDGDELAAGGVGPDLGGGAAVLQ